MKKLLLSLMVFSVLSSCGKDNKVGNTVPPITPASSINPYTANDTAVQLINYINTSELSFVKALGNPTYFKYTTYTSTYNCKEKEGWFKIEYTSCKTDNETTDELVPISSLDLEKKKQELRDIVAASSQSIEMIGLAYRITTNNGSVYVIHRNTPILSNPYSVQTINGSLTRYTGLKYNK